LIETSTKTVGSTSSDSNRWLVFWVMGLAIGEATSCMVERAEFVWREPTDGAVLEKTLNQEVPQVLDYLESQVPIEGFIFGDVSIERTVRRSEPNSNHRATL
jgi:hypothetical protein